MLQNQNFYSDVSVCKNKKRKNDNRMQQVLGIFLIVTSYVMHDSYIYLHFGIEPYIEIIYSNLKYFLEVMSPKSHLYLAK